MITLTPFSCSGPREADASGHGANGQSNLKSVVLTFSQRASRGPAQAALDRDGEGDQALGSMALQGSAAVVAENMGRCDCD